MKKFYFCCIALLIFLKVELFCQNSNSGDIKNYPGIPVVGAYWFGYMGVRPDVLENMKIMGVDFLQGNISSVSEINHVQSNGLGIIVSSAFNEDWISYYTDAKYTEWEAEGTNPEKGFATLERDTTNALIEIQNGDTTYLKLTSQAANRVSELIYGPFYHQEVKYYTGIRDYVTYKVDFVIKLEINLEDTTNNPNEDICILQVTQSKLDSPNVNWNLGCTHVINADTVRINNLQPLGKFVNRSFEYKLTSNECQSPPPGYGLFRHSFNYTSGYRWF